MSHTNSTTNYNLPQFITSDKPAWLTDVNNAFSDIDAGMYAAQTKADTAFTDAGLAQGDATTAINNAAAADAKGSGAIASIEVAFDPTTVYSVGAKVMYNSLLYRCIVAVTTPGPWTGSNNWERITVDSLISATDSKIGQLTSLATTDKTSIVNAINEVNGKAVKSVFITTTYNCTYADNNTVGFRGTGPNITTLTGYPATGNVLAVVIERNYVDNPIYPAITSIDLNTLYTESKKSGTVYIGMKVLYTD